jgi:hypothetical protein
MKPGRNLVQISHRRLGACGPVLELRQRAVWLCQPAVNARRVPDSGELRGPVAGRVAAAAIRQPTGRRALRAARVPVLGRMQMGGYDLAIFEDKPTPRTAARPGLARPRGHEAIDERDRKRLLLPAAAPRDDGDGKPRM